MIKSAKFSTLFYVSNGEQRGELFLGAKGLSPVRPTRWTVHWTLHFCFAKTLHFVRGSIFKPLCFFAQKNDRQKCLPYFLVRAKGLEPPRSPTRS